MYASLYELLLPSNSQTGHTIRKNRHKLLNASICCDILQNSEITSEEYLNVACVDHIKFEQ